MIQEIFDNISDDELTNAIQEIQDTNQTGVIGNTVKKYGDMIGKIAGHLMPHDYKNARILILEQAAFRWKEMYDEMIPIKNLA